MKTPGIVPYINNEILEEFAYQSVNSKPEPPWIKRLGNEIKFTDQIYESNNTLSSSSSKENNISNDSIDLTKNLSDDSKKKDIKSYNCLPQENA